MALDFFSDLVRLFEDGNYKEGKLHGKATIFFKSAELIKEFPDEIDEDLDHFHCIFNKGIPSGKALIFPANRREKIEVLEFDKDDLDYLGALEVDDPLVSTTTKELGLN
tara:strand:- start:78 stop:404 length:327 start_codon:yes stop_codon:yes gene_type:complete